MKKNYLKITSALQHKKKLFLYYLIFFLNLMLISDFVYAAADLLAGATGEIHTTMAGTGKKVLLIIEGLSALIYFLKTKNVYVLFTVVIISFFINWLLGMTL